MIRDAHLNGREVCQSDFQLSKYNFYEVMTNMLRVVGGIHRSRQLKEVPGEGTRPTTDKNKEAVFNILGQYFSGGMMLDLFAGSGALGIEAISRGISHVDFIDNAPLAKKTIEQNLEALKLNDNAKVIRNDVFEVLPTLKKKYDLIIADPPYALNRYQDLLDAIVYGQLVVDNGIIVFEADAKASMPERSGRIIKYREKVFGNTKFAFYRMEESE